MPPKKSSLIRQFFKYDLWSNTSTCVLEKTVIAADGTETSEATTCGRKLKGQKASVLEKHVQSKHGEVFEGYMQLKPSRKLCSVRTKTLKRAVTSNTSEAETSSSVKRKKRKRKIKQPRVPNYCNNNSVAVYVNRDEIIEAIVHMVTVGGTPFSFVDDPGFQRIMTPIYRALNLDINQHSIVDLINDQYETIKLKLQQMLQNKLVSVKVDCASRMLRCFLGISVQFIHNDKIVRFTLAAIELPVRQAGSELKKIILDELEKFAIKPSQIYSITTDNGANMLKAVTLLNGDGETTLALEFYDQNDGDSVEDPAEEAIRETERLEENEIHLAEGILNSSWNEHVITSVKCAAHSLQLSVHHTLRNTNKTSETNMYLEAIEEARTVVKELRTPDVMALIRNQTTRKPVLDCTARWSSTYLMLRILFHEFRAFCDEYGSTFEKLKLTAETWRLIQEIVDSLQPCVIATLQLQQKQLTLTDVYRILNVCQMETNVIGSPLSADLVDNLVKRRDVVFSSETFLSCMYLDPRFRFELADLEKEIAIVHIGQIYKKCQALLESVKEDVSDEEFPDDSPSCIEDPIEAAERRYERALAEKQKHIMTAKKSNNLDLICRSFDPPLLKARDDILKWWEKNKTRYPELHVVAEVLFSVPATQDSIEALFSQMKFILEDRTYLIGQNLNNVLVLKNNFDVFREF